jgi:hypothetical protein
MPFIDPSYAALSSLEDYLAKQHADQRQALIDSITQRREEQQMTLAQQQADALTEQRQQAASANQQAQALKVAGVLAPGQAIDPSTATFLSDGGFSSLVTPAVPATLATVEQQPTQIGPGLLQQGSGPTLGTATFRGTPAQLDAQRKAQALDQYLTDPVTPAVVKQFIIAQRASGDNSLPADLFKTPPPVETPDEKMQHALALHSAERTFDNSHPTPVRDPVVDQNKLEQQYRTVLTRGLSSRSGGLGLEDAKVQQANHLLAIFDQNYSPATGQYAIPTVQLNELALGLARLTAPGGQAGEQMLKEFQQRTANGDLAGALSYITGTPVPANTQSITQMLKDSIQRQGSVAQTNREGEMSYLRNLAPTELDEGRRTKLESTSLNPLRQSRVIQNPQTGERRLQVSIDGGKTWQ